MLKQVAQTMFWTAHLCKNVQVKCIQMAKFRLLWSHRSEEVNYGEMFVLRVKFEVKVKFVIVTSATGDQSY